MEYTFLLVLFAVAGYWGCSADRVEYPEELQQLHQNLLDDILISLPDWSDVRETLETMDGEGRWPDIDYGCRSGGAWRTMNHLSRLRNLAKAYRTRESGFYRDDRTLDRMHLAYNYWIMNDPRNPNWWYNEIGVPRAFGPIMILLEAELSETQLLKGIRILERSTLKMTGQNKVWLAGNLLQRSLLLRDVETVRKASEAIRDELVVTTEEGLQPDWSYHQHGPQLQFGNYGLHFADDMTRWITLLRGTPFHFDEGRISLLRNYMLQGMRWVVWKDQMDISSCGRQLLVDSPRQKAGLVMRYLERLKRIDPGYSAEYKDASDYRSLSGNRHFWRSDYQIQRSPEYFFSVKMCSERVVGAESAISENVQGYFMGDGVTFLYQSGEEYENIFPFWNWKKVPGITVHQDDKPLPILTYEGYRIDSDFVGGVSDGVNGVAVMEYVRDGLNAKKSWFMFGDMIICLGSGITSSEGHPVATSVNQVFYAGNATIKTVSGEDSPTGTDHLNDPLWILHDNTGYLFPDGGRLVLSTGKVQGSWHNVAFRYPDESISADVFKLWFDHGTNPSDCSYAYILVPGADRKRMEQLRDHPPFTVRNNLDRQEVISADGSKAGLVFYEPGRSPVFGGVEVDVRCVLMLKRNNNGIHVSVSDPSQKHEEANIVLQGVEGPLAIEFPRNEYAGKTVSVFVEMPAKRSRKATEK